MEEKEGSLRKAASLEGGSLEEVSFKKGPLAGSFFEEGCLKGGCLEGFLKGGSLEGGSWDFKESLSGGRLHVLQGLGGARGIANLACTHLYLWMYALYESERKSSM